MKKYLFFLLATTSLHSTDRVTFSYMIHTHNFAIVTGMDVTGKNFNQEIYAGYDFTENKVMAAYKKGYILSNLWDKIKYISFGSNIRTFFPVKPESDIDGPPFMVGLYLQRADAYTLVSLEYPVWSNKSLKKMSSIPWCFRIGFKF